MADGTVGITGTGIHYGADRARPELLEQRREGEHVWMIATVHVVTAEALRGDDTMVLDAENLALCNAGCFICETPYAERMTYRQCPGEPRR